MTQGWSLLGITDIRMCGYGPQLILGKTKKFIKLNASPFEAESLQRYLSSTCPEKTDENTLCKGHYYCFKAAVDCVHLS